MEKQKTINREVDLKGVGLHTANKVTLTFKPAPIDSGINFTRIDLAHKPRIKASVDNLLPAAHSPRRTSLGLKETEVQTIEHLMAALAGLGIDNIDIELDNNEVPGLDGSSLNFIEVLQSAGIKQQDKDRQYYMLKEPIFSEEEGASIVALPSSEYRISYALDYNHPVLSSGFLEIKLTPDFFQQEIASARTFCLEEEAQELQRTGVGMGANFENTLVVGKKGVIKNKLRFADEFVRHKILDLMGDLYLIGSPLKVHIIALKSGHSLNLKLAKKISQQKERFSQAGVGSVYQLKDEKEFGIETIKKILPHREPFLFLDKIIHLEKGKRCLAAKNVTINDYFFKGHFPGRPVMPGVLIVEAMAQAGGVMMLSSEGHQGKLAFFMAADKIKFRKAVLPGDQLLLDVTAGRIKSRTGQLHGKALVDGKVVAEAELMFALVDF